MSIVVSILIKIVVVVPSVVVVIVVAVIVVVAVVVVAVVVVVVAPALVVAGAVVVGIFLSILCLLPIVAPTVIIPISPTSLLLLPFSIGPLSIIFVTASSPVPSSTPSSVASFSIVSLVPVVLSCIARGIVVAIAIYKTSYLKLFFFLKPPDASLLSLFPRFPLLGISSSLASEFAVRVPL